MAADSQGMLVRGSSESTTLVIALVKALVDTVNANGVLVVVIGDCWKKRYQPAPPLEAVP